MRCLFLFNHVKFVPFCVTSTYWPFETGVTLFDWTYILCIIINFLHLFATVAYVESRLCLICALLVLNLTLFHEGRKALTCLIIIVI